MSFANTFISLSDVDISSLTAGKFLRVRPTGDVEISQYDITTDTLTAIGITKPGHLNISNGAASSF